MRRRGSIAVTYLLVASLLAPAAYASLAAISAHACCRRAAAHEHCAPAPQAGWSAKSDCHGCCFWLSLRQPAPRSRSADGGAWMAPPLTHLLSAEAHTPAVAGATGGPQSPRAPPRSSWL